MAIGGKRSYRITIEEGLISFLSRPFVGQPPTPGTFAGAEAGHGLARDIFSAMALRSGQDVERLYALITYYAKQAFVICGRGRDDEAGRDAALAALMEHYLRARMAHQILAACDFLGHCRPSDERSAANEDVGYAALRVHPGIAAALSMVDALEALLPAQTVSEAASSTPRTINDRFFEQEATNPGQPTGQTILNRLDARNLVPERWGVDLHDTYGVQWGLNALSAKVTAALDGFKSSGPHFASALATVNAIEELGEAQVEQSFAELKSFFTLAYSEQTVFAARQQFEKLRAERDYDVFDEMSAGQIAFLGLSLLNSRPAQPNIPAYHRRTLRIDALAKLLRATSEEKKAEVLTHPILDAQLRDLAARTSEYLGRQFDKRPVSLTHLARARRDFQTLEFDILSPAQIAETPDFKALAERLSASSVKSDEDLIAMALCESEIKVIEQVEGWMIEHLHPFLSSRGAVGSAERTVAIGACEIAVTRMLRRVETLNAEHDKTLPENAATDGRPYAFPFMSLGHVDAARLAAASARLVRYINPEQGADSRKLLTTVRDAKLLNGQGIYDYAHGFFEATLTQFLKDDGADLAHWTRMAEQVRVYAALLEMLDTDFLHNESPKYLKEIYRRIKARLEDGKRPAQTPREASLFLRLCMIAMKISRQNTILDALTFRTPDGRTQIPVAPLALKDKGEGADPVSLIQTLVALSEEVGRIHTRNVKSVTEQKYETFERHAIAMKLEDFLNKIGKNARDADGDFDLSGVQRDDITLEGVEDNDPHGPEFLRAVARAE